MVANFTFIPNYLLIAGGRIIGFITSQKVLYKMQNSLIQDLQSGHRVYFDYNHYTMSTFPIWFQVTNDIY